MNYDIEIYLIYVTLNFYQQETVEINGKWYISVKETAKAYGVHIQTIHKQLNSNPKIFEDHVKMTKAFIKKFGTYFTNSELKNPKKFCVG